MYSKYYLDENHVKTAIISHSMNITNRRWYIFGKLSLKKHYKYSSGLHKVNNFSYYWNKNNVKFAKLKHCPHLSDLHYFPMNNMVKLMKIQRPKLTQLPEIFTFLIINLRLILKKRVTTLTFQLNKIIYLSITDSQQFLI